MPAEPLPLRLNFTIRKLSVRSGIRISHLLLRQWPRQRGGVRGFWRTLGFGHPVDLLRTVHQGERNGVVVRLHLTARRVRVEPLAELTVRLTVWRGLEGL